LQHLIDREPPLAMMLPRQPGTKEARYDHLLSDHPRTYASAPVTGTPPDRLPQLEQEVSELRREVSELKQQLAEFRKMFE